jgi:signal transduction histidine kinase
MAPRTLRGRLIGTTLIVAFVVVASTFTIASAFNARLLRVRSEAAAAQTLRGFSDYLDSQAQDIRFEADQLAKRPDIVNAVATGNAAVLARELGEQEPATGGFEVLVTGKSSKIIYTRTREPGCVTCMQSLLKHSQRDVSGPVLMPDGPYLVVSSSIGATSGPSLGRLVLARRLGDSGSNDFPAITGASMTLSPPGKQPRPPGWQPLDVRDFTKNTRFNTSGASIQVAGTLIGVDGKPVTDVLMVQNDPSFERNGTFAWISILASSIFAGIIGLSVGVVIADVVREPVDSMVGRVKKEGFRAIEGMPYSGVSLDNPRLPNEFRELGAVVDGLLYGLSARQAELKRVTSATQEAEEALAVTVNESTDATVLVQDGLIRVANPATTSHFGVTPRNLLGRTPKEAFDAMELAREDGTPVQWKDLLREASEKSVLVRNSVAGRGERWLEVRIVNPPAAIKDRLLLTARDTTDSRRLEQLRTELISMISHDLRTPLTVIVGYLDLLGTDLPEPSREKALSAARSNAMRMESMLEDLLSATRAEELFAPKVLLPVRLCAMAEDVGNSLRAASPDHGISVVCDREGVTLGEEKRLRQALANLVSNAVKFSPTNSDVVIRVGSSDGRVLVAVEDGGPGVPDDQKLTVFDRFTRVENGTGKPGLGLGLYIVRVVVEGHGGRAYVEDMPSGGSRFVMDLPAAVGDRTTAASRNG